MSEREREKERGREREREKHRRGVLYTLSKTCSDSGAPVLRSASIGLADYMCVRERGCVRERRCKNTRTRRAVIGVLEELGSFVRAVLLLYLARFFPLLVTCLTPPPGLDVQKCVPGRTLTLETNPPGFCRAGCAAGALPRTRSATFSPLGSRSPGRCSSASSRLRRTRPWRGRRGGGGRRCVRGLSRCDAPLLSEVEPQLSLPSEVTFSDRGPRFSPVCSRGASGSTPPLVHVGYTRTMKPLHLGGWTLALPDRSLRARQKKKFRGLSFGLVTPPSRISRCT